MGSPLWDNIPFVYYHSSLTVQGSTTKFVLFYVLDNRKEVDMKEKERNESYFSDLYRFIISMINKF